MSTTDLLLLPYLEASQAQKHVTHNEALRMLDGLIQASVIDATTTAPPGSPAEGDRYIVATSGSGAWAGWDKSIAYRADAAWFRLIPQTGWWVYNQATGLFMLYNGGAWVTPGFVSGVFADNLFRIVDDADPTKIAAFQASGISTGTTRTYTLPNVSGTLLTSTSTIAWSSITSTPTTLSGYGITDGQPLDADLTAIAAITHANDDFIQAKAGAWVNRTPAQVTADLPVATTSNKGLAPVLDGNSAHYLDGNGGWTVPAGGGGGGGLTFGQALAISILRI